MRGPSRATEVRSSLPERLAWPSALRLSDNGHHHRLLRALRRRRDPLALERRSLSTRLTWEAPASTITISGIHGGAGATTLCLLLAHALANFGQAPALTVDLAGRSRGGLAVLGGAAGQTTAEATAAVAAVHGGRLERPLGINEAGVRILGTHPDGVEALERGHEALVARLVEAVAAGAEDARLAELVRLAVREDEAWQALRVDNEQAAAAVGRVLDQAVDHHALVAVDLGMLESHTLARMALARSDLHVWVLPGRAHSLEIAQRRLPEIRFEGAGAEAIAVWQAEEQAPSTKRLSALGDLRGCRVVRMGSYGKSLEWSERLMGSLSGVTDLCELAR